MRHLIVGFHIRDLLFDELEVRDLLTLDLASIRIRDRRVTRRADDTGRTRSHGVSSVLEREHRDLESLTFLTEHVRCRHADVLQRKVTGVTGANAKLAVDRAA